MMYPSLEDNINRDLKKLIEASEAETITASWLALALRDEYADNLDPLTEYLTLAHLKGMAEKILIRMYGATPKLDPDATYEEFQASSKAFFDHANALEAEGKK